MSNSTPVPQKLVWLLHGGGGESWKEESRKAGDGLQLPMAYGPLAVEGARPGVRGSGEVRAPTRPV